jgi:nucleoside-triphosphatase THEP1
MSQNQTDIIIVTGPVNSGKTSMMLKLIEQEKQRNISPTGIIARAIIEGDKKNGYEAVNIATGQTTKLAGIEEWTPDSFTFGKFIFSDAAFVFAKKALLDFHEGGVVFLDETGPLELSGSGHAEVLIELLNSEIARLYISVRDTCLDDFIKIFLEGKIYQILQVERSL